MERIITRDFVYPAFLTPPPSLSFSDQFAFRPTGSTTAALTFILHTVTNLLTTNPYVIVLALDFSKAFDTVRHSKLMEKYAMLDIPDNIYNWLVEYFSGHSHSTRYHGQMSDLLQISASIIQGSAIGPASYDVTASDLAAASPGNILCKYADDTYVIIPAQNVDTRTAELLNIEAWARDNNLTLNTTCHRTTGYNYWTIRGTKDMKRTVSWQLAFVLPSCQPQILTEKCATRFSFSRLPQPATFS